MVRTITVGALLVLTIGLTITLSVFGGNIAEFATTPAQENIEIEHSKDTIKVTLINKIEADSIFVSVDGGIYKGGINNNSIDSILGPENGNQYLLSKEYGGPGTTVTVDITNVDKPNTLYIKQIRGGSEQTIINYNL